MIYVSINMMNLKIKHLALIFFLFFYLSNPVSAFQPQKQPCSKCHTLNKDEALLLLKNFNQNVNVINIKKGPVSYLWEIEIELNNKKSIIYMDLSKKHIFDGSLLQIQGKKNITQERLSYINKVDVSKIPLDDAIILGAKNFRKKIIIFDDPD